MTLAIAALINGRARRVTPEVVCALRRALPGSTVLVSADFDEARRHVRALIRERPDVLLSGGGDGAAMRLMNFWRDEGGGALPALGILRLGTGNGWARALGAPAFFPHLRTLAALRSATSQWPLHEVPLVEVEKHLCHFAGVGWDARIVNDYQRNLEKQAARRARGGVGAWLHQGVRGYLYAVARITIPEEWRRTRKEGQARVVLENAGAQAFTLDARARPVPAPFPGPLHEGPVSVGAASTVPEWGYGFRAFPFAGLMPGFINVRVYSGQIFETVRNAARLWRGDWPMRSMRDWFVTAVRMRFSRPMPFQIGGDAMGQREEIVLRAARETVRVVDWRTALAQ